MIHFSEANNFLLFLFDFSSKACRPTLLCIELCSVYFDRFSSLTGSLSLDAILWAQGHTLPPVGEGRGGKGGVLVH